MLMHVHDLPFQGNTHHEANTGYHADEVDAFRDSEDHKSPGCCQPDHQAAHLDEVGDQEVDDVDRRHVVASHLQLEGNE